MSGNLSSAAHDDYRFKALRSTIRDCVKAWSLKKETVVTIVMDQWPELQDSSHFVNAQIAHLIERGDLVVQKDGRLRHA